MKVAEQLNVYQEQQKCLLVPVTYAIADPGAVVVHAGDATVALAAVVGPGGFYTAAGGAFFAETVDEDLEFRLGQLDFILELKSFGASAMSGGSA